MRERVFARVLPAFAVVAALALTSCGHAGPGAGTIPVNNSLGNGGDSAQSFTGAPGTPLVIYISGEGTSFVPSIGLPALGGAASRLPDGGVAHVLPLRLPGAVVPNIQPNMTYHGGPIQKSPRQVLDLWGFGSCSGTFPSPTCTNDPNHTTEILGHFLKNVGGSNWLSIVTQYYSTAQGHITNPTNTLLAVVIDTTAAPLHPSNTDLLNAAVRVEKAIVAHGIEKGINKDVNYVLALGKNHYPAGFGVTGGYCAYHTYWYFTASPSNKQPFTVFPYIPAAGAGCGANTVSGPNDGVSIVLGHEAAEAITDPWLNAWFDTKGEEIGDKCAWMNLGFTTLLNLDKDPVQPLWSNAVHACVRK